MSKRRNPKREKAARNKAYARKFRKPPTGRFQRRQDNWHSEGQSLGATDQTDDQPMKDEV
ncbi:MAG: hypothetical protein NW237_07370 [Cyanobacteriota bacterium]|nr:hypothetical protein [Cyanobacteriota bacterium]